MTSRSLAWKYTRKTAKGKIKYIGEKRFSREVTTKNASVVASMIILRSNDLREDTNV